MAGRSFIAPFLIGDRVIIDGDRSVVARCIAFTFRADFCQAEIAWMNAGTSQSVWIDTWRLTPAPE